MCGIYGCYRSPNNARDFVSAGLDRIAHRGPDGRAIANAGDCTHGHVRLALVDLSPASSQPFPYRSVLLSFNGEVWNFRALRAELEGLGHVFTTSGDTEVFAAAIDQWGKEALDRIEGMFAITVSDSRRREVWLARDRFGKVPLYGVRAGKGFAWSSERKGFPPGARAQAGPIGPGTIVDLNTLKATVWYSAARSRSAPATPETVLALLSAAVEKRLMADAPVCCLISGGLDSSLILALACKHATRPVTAYTAYLDKNSPDLAAARRLCAELCVKFVEVPIPAITRESLAAAAYAIEIPSKAQIEIAALCLPLARVIAADGFKACLSGEAADELFGGYGSMCIKAAAVDDDGWRQICLDQLEKMARGNFIRCNKAFMAAGVECRLPFMERGLVESLLATGKEGCPPGKRLVKEAALRSGLVPEWVVKRTKETFQGAGGTSAAAERVVGKPVQFYNDLIRRQFGSLVTG